jgi:hypothetical protein
MLRPPASGSTRSRRRSAWRWSSATPTTTSTCSWRSRAAPAARRPGLWAGDVYRMLTRYAERLGFTVEPLSRSAEGKYTFAIKGDGAYSVFKFEGGTHRVQRVPTTESQGRIHTSTATVAVLPEAEEVDVSVDPNDLQIDVYRSSGPGGQSVNTTDSAVRVTHRPTGHRRLDAGREVPAAEPREGAARAARPPVRARAGRAAGGARAGPLAPRSGPASGPRRSAPTTTPSGASRTTASTCALQPRRDPRRRAGRADRRAAGRREAPAPARAGWLSRHDRRGARAGPADAGAGRL